MFYIISISSYFSFNIIINANIKFNFKQMKVNFSRIIIKPDKEWMLNIITNLLQCKICMNIINDPYDCLCCNQTFCKNCIMNYIKTNTKCPYANYFQAKENTQSYPCIKPSSSNLKKLVNLLKFNCVYHNNGCNCEIPIEDLAEHESNCQFKNKKEVDTSFKLDELSAKKDKFKFQDSCMSFKKVDISQLDIIGGASSNRTNNNQKIVDKIDSLYEMMSNYLKSSNKDPPIINNKAQNKKPITHSNKNKNKSYDLESTPKFTFKKQKPIEADVSSLKLNGEKESSKTNEESPMIIELKKIKIKLSNLERILQANTSLQHQEYSIEHKVDSSVMLSKCDNIYSSSVNNSMIGTRNTTQKGSNKLDIRKTFSQQVFTNSFGLNSGNKHITNRKVIKENSMFTSPTNKKVNESTMLNSEQIESVLNDKIESIKTYIDEKIDKELKQYFLDIFLDNTNLVVQKFEESIMTKNKLCDSARASPNITNTKEDNQSNNNPKEEVASFNSTNDNCTNNN